VWEGRYCHEGIGRLTGAIQAQGVGGWTCCRSPNRPSVFSYFRIDYHELCEGRREYFERVHGYRREDRVFQEIEFPDVPPSDSSGSEDEDGDD
jgi:hypothetical protein